MFVFIVRLMNRAGVMGPQDYSEFLVFEERNAISVGNELAIKIMTE
jgi:hypothetical protein